MNLHFHFHGDVEITFPPTGDIPSPLFDSLKELLTMNQTELKTALESHGTALEAIVTTLAKVQDEIVVALSAQGAVSPEVEAAVNKIGTVTDAIKTALQALDDLNPDAPPAA
jgi:hypothetical protein